MDAHKLVKEIFKTVGEDYIDNGYWISIYCSEPKIHNNINIEDYLEILSSEVGIDLSKYKKDKLYAIYCVPGGYYEYREQIPGQSKFAITNQSRFIEYFSNKEDAKKLIELFKDDDPIRTYEIREKPVDGYFIKIEDLFGEDFFVTAFLECNILNDKNSELFEAFSNNIDY